MKILLVDDDPLVRMGATAMVEDLGHEVLEAGSGREAMQVFEQNGDIELLITDYSMPGMNGAELASAARRLKPRLDIILMTGYGDTLPNGESQDSYRKLGKPFLQTDLARLIENYG